MPRPERDDDLPSAIGRALAPVTAVRAAWLFGSRASGAARPDSDLDVAVAYPTGLGNWDREVARRAVVGALTDALGTVGERADVVDLDRADSDVCFSAIARGRCVLARSEADRIDAEVRVARRFHDDAYYRDLFDRAAVEAWKR